MLCIIQPTHGIHAPTPMLGAIMLSVVLYRLVRGDFTSQRHFAFEGAAWYWHFVDVLWLGLYVTVYWLDIASIIGPCAPAWRFFPD